eukprot:COSAG02_NODE_1315_length_13314_cov_30.517291_9_plen_337_part_00
MCSARRPRPGQADSASLSRMASTRRLQNVARGVRTLSTAEQVLPVAGGGSPPVVVASTAATTRVYKGPSQLLASRRGFADDPHVSHVQKVDDCFAERAVHAPLPRWATVPRGEKLFYEHPLPVQPDDGPVPPEERGMHIARGSVVSYTARPVGELDASLLTDCALPVMVAAGKHDGPTLLFIAGEHGNEYESIAALQTLMGSLDTSTLQGTVVGVPVTSIDSFVANQRISQDDGKNLARCWPGCADGTLTERVAFVLQHDFLGVPAPYRPVFMVALHTYAHGAGAPNGATLSGYNIYPSAPDLTEAQRQGSLATGLPLCWCAEMHNFDTILVWREC